MAGNSFVSLRKGAPPPQPRVSASWAGPPLARSNEKLAPSSFVELLRTSQSTLSTSGVLKIDGWELFCKPPEGCPPPPTPGLRLSGRPPPPNLPTQANRGP